MVVGPLPTVSPGDRFLSPVPDGRGSYERGLISTLIGWNFFFKLNVLSVWSPGLNIVPGNVTTTTTVWYSTLWGLRVLLVHFGS